MSSIYDRANKTTPPNLPPNVARIFLAGVAGVFLILTLATIGCVFENVAADEMVVIQAPGTGTLRWYTAPGWKWQGFGSVTTYKKRATYDFADFKVRFNDGGHATLKGSIQVDMPSDSQNLMQLHTRYGSQEAVQNQIVQTAVNKVLYMTGPLMSSRESYAEKRTDLIRFVQDQIDNGVYRVTTRDVEKVDQLTGQKTIASEAVITRDAAGVEVRQESSIVKEFGLRAFNFVIVEINYDETVERQIQAQQQSIMAVQTAIANARKAEQDRITTEQQGMASAAQAKWSQEAEKAKAIVIAEQARDVAKLDADAAEQYKRAMLLRADADATYKRQVMAADGALAQKLEAIKAIHTTWANAFQNFKGNMVPNVVMGAGGAGASATSSAQSFMDLLMAKAAKDLALDLKPGGGGQ